jgi:AcrR family transcriptional regulator
VNNQTKYELKKALRKKQIQERKEYEKDMRRRQIQAAAEKLFLTKTYSQVTMEDIAGKVKLSPTTIYFYFENKADLFG